MADFATLVGTYSRGFAIIIEPFDDRLPSVSLLCAAWRSKEAGPWRVLSERGLARQAAWCQQTHCNPLIKQWQGGQHPGACANFPTTHCSFLVQVPDPVIQLSCLDASLAMRPVFSKVRCQAGGPLQWQVQQQLSAAVVHVEGRPHVGLA